MRLVCSLAVVLSLCGVARAQSPGATVVEHIAASWSHARLGDLEDAVQAPLVDALIEWVSFDGHWTQTPIDMSVALGLIRCTACREMPPARRALLLIAEHVRASPTGLMDLVYAYAIARRCAPAQPGDPFAANIADEQRALAFALRDARSRVTHRLATDLRLAFLLYTGAGARLQAEYTDVADLDWESQTTALFEQSGLRNELIGVDSSLRGMRHDRARWMGLSP